MSAGPLHHDGGRGHGETAEEVEESGSGFFRFGRGGLLEGQAEIDDGDVDEVDADDFGGFAAGVCPERTDAHGLEKSGEAIGPGVGLPAGIREEEIQATATSSGPARLRARQSLGVVEGVVARNLHRYRTMARGMPDRTSELGGGWGAIVGFWRVWVWN